MKKSLIIALTSTTFILSSCSVNKDMQATGGSKADGTVKLSYEYGPYEKPVLDKAKALQTAKKRCKAWGYKNAESFGGSTKSCNMISNGGCKQWLVTTEYQCLDK